MKKVTIKEAIFKPTLVKVPTFEQDCVKYVYELIVNGGADVDTSVNDRMMTIEVYNDDYQVTMKLSRPTNPIEAMRMPVNSYSFNLNALNPKSGVMYHSNLRQETQHAIGRILEEYTKYKEYEKAIVGHAKADELIKNF